MTNFEKKKYKIWNTLALISVSVICFNFFNDAFNNRNKTNAAKANKKWIFKKKVELRINENNVILI